METETQIECRDILVAGYVGVKVMAVEERFVVLDEAANDPEEEFRTSGGDLGGWHQWAGDIEYPSTGAHKTVHALRVDAENVIHYLEVLAIDVPAHRFVGLSHVAEDDDEKLVGQLEQVKSHGGSA